MDDAPDIWRALGIGKTHNERAIRIAYTRRLQAIDMDASPVAFVGLRSACEAALASARGLRLVGDWLDGAPERSKEPDGPREHARADARFALELPPRAEWLPESLPPEFAQLDQLFGAAAREKRRWLTAEEKLELRRCWAAIAANGDAAAERAIRWLILNWGPLAVGLVPFAAEHFHWDTAEDETDGDGTIAEVLWRYRGVQFLQRARRPGNPYHPAWTELTSKYFEGSSRGRCEPQRVHELQAVARHVWPGVEAEFDPGRVALWRNNTADPAHPDNPRQESQFLRNLGKIVVVLIVIRIGFWVFSALLAMLGFVVSK